MEKWLINYLHLVETYPAFKTLVLTIGLVVFFFTLKKIIQLNLFQRRHTLGERNLFKKRINQYLGMILSVCLLILWFSQLQFLIVSMFAVAAAIVVALKELIMCLTGGILANVSNTFNTGDRIDIDGTRGYVIEKNLLTTKVLEIGPEKNSQQTTGDIISIPNSLMLSKSLKNESYFKGYSIKSFVYKVDCFSQAEELENELLSLAEGLTNQYIEDAKNNISRFCEKENIAVPSIEPRTKLLIENGKDISILVKLPVANVDIATVEQKINRFYLSWKLGQKASISGA